LYKLSHSIALVFVVSGGSLLTHLCWLILHTVEHIFYFISRQYGRTASATAPPQRLMAVINVK